MWGRRLLWILILAALMLAVGAIWFSVNRAVRSMILTVITGTVSRADQAGEWRPAASGTVLSPGDSISTGSASEASIAFGETAIMFLRQETSIKLESFQGGFSSRLQIQIHLETGEIGFQAFPTQDDLPGVTIRAGSANARALSSQLSVLYDESKGALFTIDNGVMSVASAGQEVQLGPGQGSWVAAGSPPSVGNYTFSVRGEIAEGLAGLVEVNGLQVGLPTGFSRTVEIGQRVHLAGRIHLDGKWLVDWIGRESHLAPEMSFTGPLIALDAQNWQVGQRLVLVGDQTAVVGNPALGSVVRVAFTVGPEGRFTARQVVKLGDSVIDSPGGSLPSPEVPRSGGVIFTDEAVEIYVCERSLSFIGSFKNMNPPESQPAADIVLGYVVTSGGEYLDDLTLAPGAWDQIPSGSQETFEAVLQLDETWLAAPTGTAVALTIFLSGSSIKPGSGGKRLSLTFIKTCPAR